MISPDAAFLFLFVILLVLLADALCLADVVVDITLSVLHDFRNLLDRKIVVFLQHNRCEEFGVFSPDDPAHGIEFHFDFRLMECRVFVGFCVLPITLIGILGHLLPGQIVSSVLVTIFRVRALRAAVALRAENCGLQLAGNLAALSAILIPMFCPEIAQEQVIGCLVCRRQVDDHFLRTDAPGAALFIGDALGLQLFAMLDLDRCCVNSYAVRPKISECLCLCWGEVLPYDFVCHLDFLRSAFPKRGKSIWLASSLFIGHLVGVIPVSRRRPAVRVAGILGLYARRRFGLEPPPARRLTDGHLGSDRPFNVMPGTDLFTCPIGLVHYI